MADDDVVVLPGLRVSDENDLLFTVIIHGLVRRCILAVPPYVHTTNRLDPVDLLRLYVPVDFETVAVDDKVAPGRRDIADEIDPLVFVVSDHSVRYNVNGNSFFDSLILKEALGEALGHYCGERLDRQ